MSQNGYTFSQAQPYDATVAQPVPESLRSGLDDPCSGAEIVLPENILPILQTAPFIRLKGLKQLGVCSYVRFRLKPCLRASPPQRCNCGLLNSRSGLTARVLMPQGGASRTIALLSSLTLRLRMRRYRCPCAGAGTQAGFCVLRPL